MLRALTWHGAGELICNRPEKVEEAIARPIDSFCRRCSADQSTSPSVKTACSTRMLLKKIAMIASSGIKTSFGNLAGLGRPIVYQRRRLMRRILRQALDGDFRGARNWLLRLPVFTCDLTLSIDDIVTCNRNRRDVACKLDLEDH